MSALETEIFESAQILAKAVVAGPDVNLFLLENGRWPKLGDEIPPWRYHGWLLAQIQICHYHPGVCNRWGYYLRTMEAGRLLDEPIPQITFSDGPHCKDGAEAEKMLRKSLDIIFHDTGSWTAFPALIDWLAWGCGVSREEPRLNEMTNESLYRHFNLGPMLLAPYDYLGFLYADGKGRYNPNAFYPTPHNVVECMTRMQMHGLVNEDSTHAVVEGRDTRTFTVCDPCVGTGRFLLHASNFSLRLYGMDIDSVCCKITQINGVLYAPWISFPFSAEVLGVKPLAAVEAPIGASSPAIPVTTPVIAQPLAIAETAEEAPQFWVNDRDQGLLFGAEEVPVISKRRRR